MGTVVIDSPHYSYASRIATLFLMELLPSRAPLHFGLQCKIINSVEP